MKASSATKMKWLRVPKNGMLANGNIVERKSHVSMCQYLKRSFLLRCYTFCRVSLWLIKVKSTVSGTLESLIPPNAQKMVPKMYKSAAIPPWFRGCVVLISGEWDIPLDDWFKIPWNFRTISSHIKP